MILPLLLAAAASPQAPNGFGPGKAPEGGTATLAPVTVNAREFELFNKPVEARRAVWRGEVVARRADVVVRCDKLTAELTADDRVKFLTCEGHAEVTQGEKWAAGERAVFDNAKGILVVTGDPKARMGKTEIRGESVTFLIDEDRMKIQKPRGRIDARDLKRPKTP